MWQVLCQGGTIGGKGGEASNPDWGPGRLPGGGGLELSNRRRKAPQTGAEREGQAALRDSAGGGGGGAGPVLGEKSSRPELEKERGAGRGRVCRGLESLQNGRLRLTCVAMERGQRARRGGIKSSITYLPTQGPALSQAMRWSGWLLTGRRKGRGHPTCTRPWPLSPSCEVQTLLLGSSPRLHTGAAQDALEGGINPVLPPHTHTHYKLCVLQLI